VRSFPSEAGIGTAQLSPSFGAPPPPDSVPFRLLLSEVWTPQTHPLRVPARFLVGAILDRA